jgi:hypothetical protein
MHFIAASLLMLLVATSFAATPRKQSVLQAKVLMQNKEQSLQIFAILKNRMIDLCLNEQGQSSQTGIFIAAATCNGGADVVPEGANCVKTVNTKLRAQKEYFAAATFNCAYCTQGTYDFSTQKCATPACASTYTISPDFSECSKDICPAAATDFSNWQCSAAASSTNTCPAGLNYNSKSKKCIKNVSCGSGYSLGNTTETNDKCVAAASCPSGFTKFDATCSKSTNFTTVNYSCPDGYALSSTGKCIGH